MWNEIIKTTILALVQGITEFLPVSSSGHLVILSEYLDIREDTLLLSLCLHCGTLLSVLLIYSREILNVLRSPKLLFFIFISSIPAGIGGCLVKIYGIDDYLFESPLIAGIGLIVTSMILASTIKRNRGEKDLVKMNLRDAFFVGLTQMIAILPGVSRSGITISTGLHLGFNGADSARYSFLIFIPAVIGASLIEIISKFNRNAETIFSNIPILLLGFLVSAVAGYISLKILINYAKKREISKFRYYCFAVGIMVIGIELFRILK